MDKAKILIITLFVGFGLYQLVNVSVLSSVVTMIAAVMLFFVMYNGWNYFGQRAAALGMVSFIVSIIDIIGSSGAFDIDGIGRTNQLLINSGEARYCPATNQPDERKREAFNSLSSKLYDVCVIQNYQNIKTLAVDFTKARYLDQVVGTADSFYNEFLNEKDKPLTCIEFAQKMDRLCPGLLEL